jgi:YHS domain-containing protein
MLKQFLVIFLALLFSYSFSIAQENPDKQKEQTQNTSTSVKTEQSIDAVTNSTEAKIWNKVCPVKGNPVEDDSPTVEYNGKLYGFCCPGCDTKFAKNPEKYSKNLSEDGTKFIGRK